MNKKAIYFRYIFISTLFVILVSLNYFHEEIMSFVPFFPNFLLPIFSIIIVIVTAYLLLQKELDVDNLKYQFLTIATHKFRTPLTAIKWITSSLTKEVTHEEKANFLRQIDVSVNRLMEVVDILTGLARFDHRMEYAYETTWIRQMIDVSLDKYVPEYKEKNINFSITADPEIPLVIIDKRKIQFVIDALFENAIRYSPPGGQIEISLRRKDQYVVFSIKDHGIGIGRNEISNLFKRYWRSNESKAAFPDGMGLSLAMVKEIIKRHHGNIWAESKGKGAGTTFFIKFPIAHTKMKRVTLNKVQGL